MKKKLLTGILPLAAASAALGQVINFHDANNSIISQPSFGYDVLYWGQGAYSDPGHDVWNGFGNPSGSGPGSTADYGGGSPWNTPFVGYPPAVFVATNNPGNPYAAYGNPPVLTTSVGTTTWGQAGGQIDSGGNPTGTASGNANSDGSFSPITLGITCTAEAPTHGTNDAPIQGTPNFLFTESVMGTGASPVIITLSNVPPATYELYLYGAAVGDSGGTQFSVNNGTPHNGISATLNKSSDGTPLPTSFVEGDNYVIFQGVVPDSHQVITITATPNPLDGPNGNATVGEADFNGLQLVTTGPAPGVLIQSYTPAQNLYAAGTANFSVSLAIGASPSYRWRSIIGGVTNNLSDGGQISGSGTSNLTISAVSAGNAGLYQCVVIAGGGTNVSTPAPLTILQSTALDILQPTDPASSYNDSIGAPAGFTASEAFDGTLAPFINFGASGNLNSFTGPAGLVVSPQGGSSILTALRFFVADSHPEDDPADYLLEGSNDGGNTFATISSGPLNLPVQRNVTIGAINITNQILQEVTFANSTAYSTYRLSANNIRNDSAPVYGLQIGEVQLLGSLAAVAPGILVQPEPVQNLFPGGTLAVGVVPNGPTPYTFQWYFNGTTLIPGATSANLILPNMQLANSGNYSCVVSNAYGSVTSSNAALTVATPNNFQQVLQSLGPVGFWPLQETSGTTAFDYAGCHNGAYQFGVVLGQMGIPFKGFSTNSVSAGFVPDTAGDTYVDIPEDNTSTTNSITGYVSSPAPSDLNYTNGVTMVAWIATAGEPSTAFTTFYGHGDPSYRMDVDGGNLPHFAMFNGNGDGDATGSVKVNDGNWHLIIGVYTPNLITNGVSALWVDGALASTHACPTPDTGDNYDVWIGGDPQYGSSRLFSGFISHAALFNYALSSNQIGQILAAAEAAPIVTLTTNGFSGNENGSATIAANRAIGASPISYQWYEIVSGTVTNPLAGQTNLSLTLTNLQVSQDGYQFLIVASNPSGSGSSGTALLQVNSGAPAFRPDLPLTLSVLFGSTLQLSANIVGTLPFTNQWYFNGAPMTTNSRISSVTSNVLTISNVQSNDAGNYQLISSNIDGSGSSVVAVVTVLPFLTFQGTGQGYVINGGPTFGTNNTLTLTDDAGNEARSAWFESQLYVGGFHASWVYQMTATNETPADGVTFCMQDSPAGLAALGNGGGALGFGGPDNATNSPGITPSVALGMSVYNGHVIGIHVLTNGIGVNAAGGPQYDSTAPVQLTSQHPIEFDVRYVAGQMHVLMTDLATNLTFSTNYIVDVPHTLGANLAYVGFTGGTGGDKSWQVVSNFTFISLPTLSLRATPTNLVIAWPGSTGEYILQQNSTILGGHPWSNVASPVNQVNGQNQAAVPLPPSGTYYRLQLQ